MNIVFINTDYMSHANLVQSLERGFDILECVARSANGMGVRALADALGLKAPTVHNLIRTLTARGYLCRATEPVLYRLGSACAVLSHRRTQRPLLAAAEQVLRALHTAHPDAVFTLAEASSHAVAVTLRASPDSPGVMQRPVGRVLSPFGSSSALLFQAFWPEEQRSAFALQYPFWECAATLWKTPLALTLFLRKVRRTGMAITHFKGEPIVKISVPVCNMDGNIAAAVGVAVPAGSLSAARRKKLIEELKAAAVRLQE